MLVPRRGPYLLSESSLHEEILKALIIWVLSFLQVGWSRLFLIIRFLRELRKMSLRPSLSFWALSLVQLHCRDCPWATAGSELKILCKQFSCSHGLLSLAVRFIAVWHVQNASLRPQTSSYLLDSAEREGCFQAKLAHWWWLLSIRWKILRCSCPLRCYRAPL